MSGDLGAEVVVRAAAETLERYRNIELVLVGDETELSGLVRDIIGTDARVRIQHASQVVEMMNSPGCDASANTRKVTIHTRLENTSHR